MNIERLLIDQPALIRALGFSKATFYRRKADPNFPRPIKIKAARQGGVYYSVDDVAAYIIELTKVSGGQQ